MSCSDTSHSTIRSAPASMSRRITPAATSSCAGSARSRRRVGESAVFHQARVNCIAKLVSQHRTVDASHQVSRPARVQPIWYWLRSVDFSRGLTRVRCCSPLNACKPVGAATIPIVAARVRRRHLIVIVPTTTSLPVPLRRRTMSLSCCRGVAKPVDSRSISVVDGAITCCRWPKKLARTV